MDYATLANDALIVATPYLQDFGKEAVDVGVKSAGKAVFDWIKARLTAPEGRKAVEGFEKAPQGAGARMVLQGQLFTLLEAEPEAAEGLKALLAAAGTVRQTLNQSGKGNIGVVASGSTVSINRR